MPTLEVQDDDEVILVEFSRAAGARSVSRSPQEIIEQSIEDSKKAIERAMETMRGMAKKTMRSIKEISVSERPSTISVSFGLKLDAEAGAVVAKAGAEAAINITMTWTHTSKAK